MIAVTANIINETCFDLKYKFIVFLPMTLRWVLHKYNNVSRDSSSVYLSMYFSFKPGRYCKIMIAIGKYWIRIIQFIYF